MFFGRSQQNSDESVYKNIFSYNPNKEIDEITLEELSSIKGLKQNKDIWNCFSELYNFDCSSKDSKKSEKEKEEQAELKSLWVIALKCFLLGYDIGENTNAILVNYIDNEVDSDSHGKPLMPKAIKQYIKKHKVIFKAVAESKRNDVFIDEDDIKEYERFLRMRLNLPQSQDNLGGLNENHLQQSFEELGLAFKSTELQKCFSELSQLDCSSKSKTNQKSRESAKKTWVNNMKYLLTGVEVEINWQTKIFSVQDNILPKNADKWIEQNKEIIQTALSYAEENNKDYTNDEGIRIRGIRLIKSENVPNLLDNTKVQTLENDLKTDEATELSPSPEGKVDLLPTYQESFGHKTLDCGLPSYKQSFRHKTVSTDGLNFLEDLLKKNNSSPPSSSSSEIREGSVAEQQNIHVKDNELFEFLLKTFLKHCNKKVCLMLIMMGFPIYDKQNKLMDGELINPSDESSQKKETILPVTPNGENNELLKLINEITAFAETQKTRLGFDVGAGLLARLLECFTKSYTKALKIHEALSLFNLDKSEEKLENLKTALQYKRCFFASKSYTEEINNQIEQAKNMLKTN